MDPNVNTETAPPVPAAEPAVVPQVVSPVVQEEGTTAAAETVNPYKEFGFETPEALLEDYKTLRTFKEKVPQLEQKINELSSENTFATPALKVVNDYQRALVANGVTDPKELARHTNEFSRHLNTDYNALADTNPEQLIEMKIWSEAQEAGITYTEQQVARLAKAKMPNPASFNIDPAKYDLTDEEDKARYDDAVENYEIARMAVVAEAKAHGARIEKEKQQLDFTPRVSEADQQAETTRKAAFDRLTDQILGYQIPDTIEIAGKLVPVQKTPELQALVAQMGKEPFKAIHDFIGVKDGVPDFNKLMNLAMIVNNLPALTAHIEANALDSATKAVEGNLDSSARAGSGQAAGQQALSKEDKAKSAVGFFFG